MTRYLLGVTFEPGVADTPMEEWAPEEVDAHLDYYRALHKELVANGEVVTVLGPSGSGKTTLLRVIAGLQVADAGRVLLDGTDLTGVPPHRRGVGGGRRSGVRW